MPPLGGPGPRRVNAGAVKRRARAVARPRIPAAAPPSFPRAVPKRPGQIVTRVPKAHYKPTAPAQRGPTPAQLRHQARIQEQGYKSQAGAVRRAAKVQKALGPGRAVRPAKGQQVLHRADIAPLIQEQSYRSLGEAVAKAKPVKVDTTATLEKASPKLRAAIGTNPKLKTQLSGMLAAGKSSDAAIAALKEQKIERGATVQAPALKALDATMRPGYAVLGSIKTDIERGGIGEAFSVHAPGSKAAKERRTAVQRGLSGKERTSGSDVLGAAGWKPRGGLGKAARAAAGLGLDIAANPLSYAQGGAGTVAERAAAKAAGKAARKGIGEGAAAAAARDAPRVAQRAAKQAQRKARVAGHGSERAARIGRQEGERVAREHVEAAQEQAIGQVARQAGQGAGRSIRRVRRRAEQKARGDVFGPLTRAQHELTRKAGERAVGRVVGSKGITIRFGGQEVPGVRRGTAFAGRGVGRVVRRTPGLRKVPGAARNLARQVRPAIAAAEYTPAQYQAGLAAARSAEHYAQHMQRRALTLAREIKAKVPVEDHAKVIRALERGDVKSLPAEYRDTVVDLRSALQEAFTKGRRSGAIKGEVGDFGTWMKTGEVQKLLDTIKSETGAQARRTGQAGVRLQRAGFRVKVAETETAGRQRVSDVRLTEQERRRTQLAHQRELGQARVTTERLRGREQKRAGVEQARATGQARVQTTQARGREAVGRVRDVGQARAATLRARDRLRKELAKPVAKRRGVPVLELRVQQAEDTWRAARTPARVEPVAPREIHPAATMSPVRRPRVPVTAQTAEPVSGARVERAATAHGERVQELEAQVARSRAAKDVPAKSRSESDEAYLRRLRDHARTHDLPLIEQRATQLLKDKPEFTRGYFPREFGTRIEKRLGIVKKQEPAGAQTGKPLSELKPGRASASYRRGEQRPLEQVNAERAEAGAEPFSTDIPTVTLNHLSELGRTTGQAQFANAMADLGREFKAPAKRHGETLAQWHDRRAAAAREFEAGLGDGEQLYRVGTKDGKHGLHPVGKIQTRHPGVTAAGELKKVSRTEAEKLGLKGHAGEAGRHVALNAKLVKELEGLAAHPTSSDIGAGYDRLLGKWKGLAIGSPAFHLRNLVGDLHTASYEQPLLNVLARTGPQAARAMRRESALGRVSRPTEATTATGFKRTTQRLGIGAPGAHATIKVAGKHQPLDDFLKQAREDGMIDAGYAGAEIHDMANNAMKDMTSVRKPTWYRKTGQSMARWARNRENTMRLATYKGMLDQGKTRAEARRIANELHIDYGHLSQTERIALRRAFPFYTWTARTLPLTAKKFVTRPGKFAAYESAREETAKAFGIDPQQATSDMTKATQSALPFTVRLPGRKEPVAVSWSDPMTMLGNLPLGKDYPGELKRFGAGLLSPAVKAPAELLFNRNLATGKDIEGKHIVTAPSSVTSAIERGVIPASVVRKMKIIPPKGSPEAKRAGVPGFVDYKTGKPAWGWRGNADYAYDQTLLGFQGQVAAVLGAGRSPSQSLLQSAGAIAGARLDPLDKNAAKYAGQARLRKEADRLNSRQGLLRDAGVNADHPTPEYKRNLKRLNQINQVLYPRAKKPRKTSGLGGGLGGGGLGGGGL